MVRLKSCGHAAAVSLFLSTLGAGANERVELRIGDSHLLATGRTVELSVSRRGVIDVHPVAAGTFELTALRRGMVIIEAHDAETGDLVPPRYVVAVTDGATGEVGQPNDRAADQAAWICELPGFTCSHGGHIVSGKTDNVTLLLAAKAACASGAAICDLELTEPARTAWQQQITARLGDGHAVTASVGGEVTIETTCAPLSAGMRRTHVTELIAATVLDAQVHVICAEHRTGKAYKLAARVVATSHGLAKETGFRTKGPAKILALDAAEHHGEIVGSPEVLITTGETVEVSAGGEFQVSPHLAGQGQHDAALAQWRRHGLGLKLGLQQAVAALRVVFEFTLRARPVSGNAAQEAHALSGTLPIAIDKPLLAGTIDVRSDGTEKLWTQGFASIPIIGPLWRLTTDDTGTTTLELWLTVKNSD